MQNRVGQQLGNYKLTRLLGQGGFAEVYLGEHIYLKTQAAVKVLHARFMKNDERTFLKEARLVASLKHPHIVRILEFGVEHATPFLVMSYAPNGNLSLRHALGTQLPLDLIISYIRPIAAALQYAHDHKVIHRDVKSENLLLGRNNEVLLGDFGIAIVVHTMQSRSMQEVAGTVHYMASEQLRGKPEPASDQYAVGVLTYKWLCGRFPFDGPTYVETAFQHLYTSPPPLHLAVPTISSAVEDVVLKALAKEPQRRFTHIQAFADALEHAALLQSSLPSLPTRPLAHDRASPTVSDPAQPSLPSSPRLSRRIFLVGSVGLALAGSGIAAHSFLQQKGLSSRSSRSTVTAGSHPSVPTPSSASAPPKLGSTLYVYRGHPYNYALGGNAVGAVAWSPQGKRIASNLDGSLQIWEATTGKGFVVPHTSGYLGSNVSLLAWSPDGKRVVTPFRSNGDLDAQIWDATTGRPLLTYYGRHEQITALGWSPDGTRIATGNYFGTVQVWDANTGNTLHTYSGHVLPDNNAGVFALAWSPDSKYIASGGFLQIVQLWNATTGETLATYRGPDSADTSGDAVQSLSWSSDGKRLVIVADGRQHIAQVWDVATGTDPLTYHDDADSISSAVWSPDGKRIATGCADSAVQIWDATTGQHQFTYTEHEGAVVALSWSPDSRDIASGSSDNTVRVWRAV